MNNPYFGEGYVPAYQLSSTPWVTSSQVVLGQTVQISFPQVTRFIIISNNAVTASSVMNVAFTQNGLTNANANFIPLSGTNSFSAELRTDRLFISGSAGTSQFTVVAGLTPIQKKDFLVITASNGFSGVG